MLARAHSRLRPLPLAVLAVAACLAGCGTGPADTAAAPRTSTIPNSPAASAPSPRPSHPPKTPQATSTPKQTPATPGGQGPAALQDRLLSAAAMPGYGTGFTWRAAATRSHEGQEPFATCHRFPMTAIGATRVVTRTFRPAHQGSPAVASDLVAEFPDQATARRAYQVLASWRGQCGDRLDRYDQHDVGTMRAVQVDQGSHAAWYQLTYGPADGTTKNYLDAQGLTRNGRLISVVQMRTVGRAASAGQEMVSAVQAAAGRLG
jgi:hypothetical protein